MAVLREPGVWLERSTRLRRQPQHRRSRHGLSHDFSRNREVCRISHDLAGGQALLVHRAGRDAALASMVARLTLGKADYVEVQPEIEALLQQTEKLRGRFQELMQEDIEAYGRLSASFKMPRGTPEEVDARSKSIQEQLVEAALVPLEMVECASALVKCCHRIAEIGNAKVLSDVATGALLDSSCGGGAACIGRAYL